MILLWVFASLFLACVGSFENTLLSDHRGLETWERLDQLIADELSRQRNDFRTIESKNRILIRLHQTCPELQSHPVALSAAKLLAWSCARLQDLKQLAVQESTVRLAAQGFRAVWPPQFRREKLVSACGFPGPMFLKAHASVVAQFENQNFAGGQIRSSQGDYRWNYYFSQGLPR
jgi:hypothetical protein